MIATENICLSEDQDCAFSAIMDWRSATPTQTLSLGGYAGTGKTTLVSMIYQKWSQVKVAALCGKAASVLRSKGVEASTIHSLIYEIKKDRGRVWFERRDRLSDCKTIVIDEASMINLSLYEDLLAFDLPILFVGDHGQLEPIGNNPGIMDSPDIRLEKIHRQAEANPILRLATAFREGRSVPNWKSACGRLAIESKRRSFDFGEDDQIICGFHGTRHELNAMARAKFGRRGGPRCGDRVTCLRNSREHGVFNGEIFFVDRVSTNKHGVVELELTAEDGSPRVVPCLLSQFGRNLDKDHRDRGVCLFDFGNAITAHKSQGSEFDNVIVVQEVASAWNFRRWAYTCATRAKQTLRWLR